MWGCCTAVGMKHRDLKTGIIWVLLYITALKIYESFDYMQTTACGGREKKKSPCSDHETRHKCIMNADTHFCSPHFMFSEGARKFKIRMSCAVLSLILTGRSRICQRLAARAGAVRQKHSDDWRAYCGGLICAPLPTPTEEYSVPAHHPAVNTGTLVPCHHASREHIYQPPPPFCSLPSPCINHFNSTFFL